MTRGSHRGIDSVFLIVLSFPFWVNYLLHVGTTTESLIGEIVPHQNPHRQRHGLDVVVLCVV